MPADRSNLIITALDSCSAMLDPPSMRNLRPGMVANGSRNASYSVLPLHPVIGGEVYATSEIYERYILEE